MWKREHEEVGLGKLVQVVDVKVSHVVCLHDRQDEVNPVAWGDAPCLRLEGESISRALGHGPAWCVAGCIERGEQDARVDTRRGGVVGASVMHDRAKLEGGKERRVALQYSAWVIVMAQDLEDGICGHEKSRRKD